jgi:hypothetical protein
MRSPLLLSVLLAAVLAPAPANARPLPQIAHESCFLEVSYDQATCYVTILPGTREFFVAVHAGYGGASLSCPNSGYSRWFGGDRGTDHEQFTATADLCTLQVDARDGWVMAEVA